MPTARVKITKVCVQCGVSFEASKANARKARFCSRACRAALYRKERRYAVERLCVICQKPFTVSAPSEKTRACSPACGRKLADITNGAASIKAAELSATDTVVVLSETVQLFRGVAYYLCGQYFQHGGRRLHQEVWRALHGAIPKGYDVHHKDENRSNNQPHNLEALPEHEHLSARHGEASAIRGRDHILKAIAAAPAWHKSEEGRAWHSQHAARVMVERVRPQIPKVCEHCEKPYLAPAITARTQRFCSNACKTAWRYAQGVDSEIRTCVVCGRSFTVRSKYESTKTCSRSCGAKRWRNLKPPSASAS